MRSFGKSPPYFFCLALFIMLAGNGLLAGSSFAVSEHAEISCGAPRRSNSPYFQQWRFENTCSRKVTLFYVYKDSFGQNTGVSWAEPCTDSQILQVRLDAQIEWKRIEVGADLGGCDTRSMGDTLNTTAAQSSKAGDETAQLRKTAEAATAALQEEQKKTAALTSELAAARRDFETKLALSSKADDEAAQLTAELQREHQKTAALTSELVTARRDFETKLASSSKAADEAAQLKKSAERMTAELQQERDRAEASSRELAMARESAQRAIDTRTTLQRTANSQIAQVTQAVEASDSKEPAAEVSKGDVEGAKLIVRARALLGQGNIAAARIVLERAIEMGSAQASFTLAETYDPVILSAWGTYGTRGDATKARELYAKAHAGGIQEAKDRLNALR